MNLAAKRLSTTMFIKLVPRWLIFYITIDCARQPILSNLSNRSNLSNLSNLSISQHIQTYLSMNPHISTQAHLCLVIHFTAVSEACRGIRGASLRSRVSNGKIHLLVMYLLSYAGSPPANGNSTSFRCALSSGCSLIILLPRRKEYRFAYNDINKTLKFHK